MDKSLLREFWLECNETPRRILAMLKETPQTMYTRVQIAIHVDTPLDEIDYWLVNLYALHYVVCELHSGWTWYGVSDGEVTHG